MLETNNFGLLKPEKMIDNVDIDVINGNMDIVDKGLVLYLGPTSGTANAYTVVSEDIKSLAEGVAVCVKLHTAASAASTLNINGWGAKAIKKAGGAEVTNLKASMYTLRYDGTNFILQGEGASGNATASDLLLNKTATTDAGEITGTMPNNGAATAETVNLTTEGAEYTIPKGYHSGLRKIKVVISGLIASVIKAGVTVGGVLGTFTSDATATAAQMLAGATAYVNANKVTGTMPSQGAKVITPSTANQAIAAGYHNGSGYVVGDPDLIPANILSGKNIFGVAGAVQVGKKFASGTIQSSSGSTLFRSINGDALTFHTITVGGLNFKSSVIIAWFWSGVQEHLIVYKEMTGNMYPKEVVLTLAEPKQGYVMSNGIKGDDGAAYVNGTGFCMPAAASGTTYNWIAFE